MKNILITGGLGFIGFNAIQLWKKTYPKYNYVVLDKETYAADFMLKFKRDWCKDNYVHTYKCDICDEFSVESIIQQENIDTIVHFAAESHVDNSISGPNVFFQTNVIGTTTLLNIANKYDLRFHNIGTDEIYGETSPSYWLDLEKSLTLCNMNDLKNVPVIPSSPYSSSKASADLITLSYYRTFGTKATLSRCTNNFGKYQHPEKLIGTVISKILKDEKIPVYGKGNQKRHWIHVDEHNNAVMNILENGTVGKIYNIAPPIENWITNLELIYFILDYLDKPYDLVEHITDRLGHDTTYFLFGTDFCKSKKFWQDDMKNTIEWYKENLI
jgi:dTDP-glucose 4,6-dehydratase